MMLDPDLFEENPLIMHFKAKPAVVELISQETGN